MAYLTVTEFAHRSGVTANELRLRCRNGTLPAAKHRGRWLIDEAAVPALAGSRRYVGLSRRVNLNAALAHVRSLDLIEEWVPDLLRHEDQLADIGSVVAGARSRIRSGTWGPPRDVEVPKTSFFTRPGRLISLEERVAFHAVVATFAGAIDKSLSNRVYSARLAAGGKFFTRRGTNQWKRWLRYVRRRLTHGEPWMIKTDLTAYFDTIKFDLLEDELKALAVPVDSREALMGMLQAWSPLKGAGLVQGPDAARVLGNLYLAPVDSVMVAAGFGYSRYMDDVRITGATKADVIEGMRVLEKECRNRGLILSPNKTTIHSGPDALNVDREDGRGAVLYFLGARDFRSARKRLRLLLRQSTSAPGELDPRNFKFSLWRLAKLRDRTVLAHVLSRLDDLAPAASVVAEYLRPYIDEALVESELSDFLDDVDNVRHPHLVFHLFAAMLDHPGPLPSRWIDHAVRLMKDAAAPAELRGIAANLAARSRHPRVIAWIRRSAKSTPDVYLVRSYATALARVGSLDAVTVGFLRAQDPLLARSASYLTNAKSLPSLATLKARVPIP
ncbi:reverse transcriptase domain-containing protein [Nocardioides sp. W7]|uniref:reverse transcriptase domain-containing protein n=1 Tax=Nocardioides sp. W7 TaxID=2931390 RepID=UPI001FD44A2F|nr:reverse transcriptase domain-containing protein [Nocardioides sp. W7]